MTPVIKTLSVIVPVYFNAESLPELFERLLIIENKLAQRNLAMEMIFVDDGSGDDSFKVLLELKRKRPQTKLVRLTRNFGEMACTHMGFTHATGDCIAVLAADLQDPPEQILPMVDAWEEGHTLVFSHRRSRQDPWLTKLLAAGYYVLLETLVVKGYPKGGMDLMLMDKSLLPHVLHMGRGINYSLYLFWLGYKPKLLPYDRLPRRHGRSRWTLRKKLYYFIDNITGVCATPLRFVSGIGLGVSLLSFAYGISVIIDAMIKGIEVPGFVSLAVLISFSTGIILTMLSMIGEYLWRIFLVVSQHPQSVMSQAYLEPVAPGEAASREIPQPAPRVTGREYDAR
jgi:polyisoprenyl-phosphate glycosyltransferase